MTSATAPLAKEGGIVPDRRLPFRESTRRRGMSPSSGGSVPVMSACRSLSSSSVRDIGAVLRLAGMCPPKGVLKVTCTRVNRSPRRVQSSSIRVSFIKSCVREREERYEGRYFLVDCYIAKKNQNRGYICRYASGRKYDDKERGSWRGGVKKRVEGLRGG